MVLSPLVPNVIRLEPHGPVTECPYRLGVEGSTSDADCRSEDLFLSAVTVGELQAGVENVRKRDIGRAEIIETWIDRIASSYNILPMDGSAFRCWASLMHGKPPDLIADAMIAATAAVHHLTVVTRNPRDFERLGVTAFNPFG
jgi:toxin FitB